MPVHRPHRTRKQRRPAWPSFLLWVALFAIAGAGGAEERILVADIEPELIDNRLAVSAKCQNLFSPKNISTLQSGLPAAVRIDIRLVEENQVESLFSGKGAEYENVHAIEVVKSIAYNIWDERYTIRCGEEVAIFSEFPQAEKMISQVERRDLMAPAQLKPTSTYAIRMRVQIIPISAEQESRIADWLRHPDRLDTDLGAEEDDRRVQLDVNRLISVFWGKKKQARNRSAWHLSRPFRISASGELLE